MTTNTCADHKGNYMADAGCGECKQPEPAGDAAEREHCRAAVQRELPLCATPPWCVDMLMRERAAARAEGYHAACMDLAGDKLSLQTKYTALVKAARAVDDLYCNGRDAADNACRRPVLMNALRDALKREP